ncbi:hypothetical protein VP01_2222g4 [Puccinia sorghi]|uniref:OTU domain-containing protein n=1 Tax=Puccinia sorghi TaxID=27349 RepID=A0A0L6V8X6_9BASI|nr:hypothetical protein VP01_2222g4 [Puccinia sorghi]
METLVTLRKKRKMGSKKTLILNKRTKGIKTRWKKLEAFRLASQILKVFQKNFHNRFNLDGDGNCGFRCILETMEYGENGWCWVQCELTKEMGDNLSIYSRLLGGKMVVETIISQLKVSKINNKIPPSKWHSKMDQGQAFANIFQRPVLFLSEEENLSFIPTTTAVEEENSKLNPIYLMQINGNHWVLALLKAPDSSKQIPPVMAQQR